jgi:hypothetical protein
MQDVLRSFSEAGAMTTTRLARMRKLSDRNGSEGFLIRGDRDL